MKLSKIAIGKIGESLVEIELEKRGWIVFIPHFEEGIDLVVVKKVDNKFRYVGIRLNPRRPYTLRVKRTE